MVDQSVEQKIIMLMKRNIAGNYKIVHQVFKQADGAIAFELKLDSGFINWIFIEPNELQISAAKVGNINIQSCTFR